MVTAVKNFINKKNLQKKLFTPGPASLLYENITSIEPCFGRGDYQYEKIENNVLNRLKKLTTHQNIARMQGSASFALEVMINNFIYGKLLIIKTGIYSDRLLSMSLASKTNFKNIKQIDYIDYQNMGDIFKKYDWVMACPVETSIGLKIPILKLNVLKERCKANLALDATASIGLEKDHYYTFLFIILLLIYSVKSNYLFNPSAMSRLFGYYYVYNILNHKLKFKYNV